MTRLTTSKPRISTIFPKDVRQGYHHTEHEPVPFFTKVFIKIGWFLLICSACVYEVLSRIGFVRPWYMKDAPEYANFVPLLTRLEGIFLRRYALCALDILNKPIAGVACTTLRIKDRILPNFTWPDRFTGKFTDVINFGSYNYLGFSHSDGSCAEKAVEYIEEFGITKCGPRCDGGEFACQADLEKELAKFLGTEAAICCPMGFGTNSMNLPALVDSSTIVLSDEYNHASIVNGLKLSKARIEIFKHNDAADCDVKLREAFADYLLKHGKKPTKILIIVEGIYSMEGTILDLPAFIEVKKKNKAYLFMDEAHSIGAVGPNGKGIVDYWNCDPSEVDILMGTLTKSFASAGGYIAGKKNLIDYLRINSAVGVYGGPMSSPVIAQIQEAIKILCGKDGTKVGQEKIETLYRNTRYFRQRCRQLGFLIYGQDDSPVVPIVVYYLSKILAIGRKALERNLGLIVVGFPVTPGDRARIRVCLSADHTKEQLDNAINVLDEIGDEIGFKYGQNPFSPGHIIEY